MPTILEALRGRMQQRQLNAVDTIAAAARAVAYGQRYDVASIEQALVETSMSMADFEAEVEKAKQRAKWLADFEQLANSSTKVKKLEAAAEAEKSKFEAARTAFLDKANALDIELRQATTIRDKARHARDQLLEPMKVPGTLGEKYRQAVEEAEAADIAVADARRAVREQAERIESEQGWLKQLKGEQESMLQPDRIFIKGTVPPAESPRLEKHRADLAKAEKRKAEADALLTEAEKHAALAHKAVDALVHDVLKA